jgi:hypothetical protein
LIDTVAHWPGLAMSETGSLPRGSRGAGVIGADGAGASAK